MEQKFEATFSFDIEDYKITLSIEDEYIQFQAKKGNDIVDIESMKFFNTTSLSLFVDKDTGLFRENLPISTKFEILDMIMRLALADWMHESFVEALNKEFDSIIKKSPKVLLPTVTIIWKGVVETTRIFSNDNNGVREAEKVFLDTIAHHNPDIFHSLSDEDKSNIIDDGYYEFENSMCDSVCLTWGEYTESLDN